MSTIGGYWSPFRWKIQEGTVYEGKDNHPYFPYMELFYVKMGEGNDYPSGDFDIGDYMPKEVYNKTQSGEYKFKKLGSGCFANWEIIDKKGNVIFKNLDNN